MFLAAIVAGVLGDLVQSIVKQNFCLDSQAEFFSVTCKQIWVVDDEGKTGMLLSVTDKGGFLLIDDPRNYRKSVSLSIDESGGVLHLSGTEGAILAKSDNGILVYDKDSNITGSLPYHAHPHHFDKSE